MNSLAPDHLFPVQLNDSFSALKWVIFYIFGWHVHHLPLNEPHINRQSLTPISFPYLPKRRVSFSGDVQRVGPLQRALPFACVMTPPFVTRALSDNTSLSHFWCILMRIPRTYMGSVWFRKKSNSRTSFPNELLSMEQNKDAPGLNKALMVWIFGGGLPLPAI
jgi:hypothetical protein